jgi:hypothetical protein
MYLKFGRPSGTRLARKLRRLRSASIMAIQSVGECL